MGLNAQRKLEISNKIQQDPFFLDSKVLCKRSQAETCSETDENNLSAPSLHNEAEIQDKTKKLIKLTSLVCSLSFLQS